MTYPKSWDGRDQLAHLGRSVVAAGLVVGSGGNLSTRAAAGDSCWVTAAGTWLDRLTRDSFARVRIADGATVGGPVPTTELGLHLATYRVRPDVRVIVHLHPQSVLLLDALDRPIRLATTDHAFYLRAVVTVPFAPPGSPEVGEWAAAAAKPGGDVFVLARHGCSVLADSVELAHKRALYLEEAAQLTYWAALLRAELPDLPAEFRDRLNKGEQTST